MTFTSKVMIKMMPSSLDIIHGNFWPIVSHFSKCYFVTSEEFPQIA